ncbi:MAG: hypothetical protein Q9218_004518 [Villophora microphyllina]
MLLYLILGFLSLLDGSHAAPPRIPLHPLAQSNLTSPSLPVCVPISEWWQSTIYYSDCLVAWDDLHNDRAQVLQELYAFYTTTSGFEPPPSPTTRNWKLPTSKTIRTCTLEIRMIRDFHYHELPLRQRPHEEYVEPSIFPPAGVSTWNSILQDAKHVMESCVRKGQPGFMANGFARTAEQEWTPVGVFLWATGSEIEEKYREDIENVVQVESNATAVTA